MKRRKGKIYKKSPALLRNCSFVRFSKIRESRVLGSMDYLKWLLFYRSSLFIASHPPSWSWFSTVPYNLTVFPLVLGELVIANQVHGQMFILGRSLPFWRRRLINGNGLRCVSDANYLFIFSDKYDGWPLSNAGVCALRRDEVMRGWHWIFGFCMRFSGIKADSAPFDCKWFGYLFFFVFRGISVSVLFLNALICFVAGACSSRSTPRPRPPPQPTMRPNITFQTYACPEAYAKWYCLNGATCFSVKIGESILYNCE